MRYAEDDAPLFVEPASTSDLIHVVMPSMGYACGGTMLEDGGGFIIGPLPFWDRVTCPDCLAPGIDALVEECRRQQSDQATAA